MYFGLHCLRVPHRRLTGPGPGLRGRPRRPRCAGAPRRHPPSPLTPSVKDFIVSRVRDFSFFVPYQWLTIDKNGIARNCEMRFSRKFPCLFPSSRATIGHNPRPPNSIRGGARGPQSLGVTPKNLPLPVFLGQNFLHHKLCTKEPTKF